jgi:Tfp pilus assembly protein PilV
MKLLNKKLSGDTLIEVLFAFVILSAVISVAFGGAMASYRSALTAQSRTQALFLAQYQADALKTYRDSLEWDSAGGNVSFLDGVPSDFPIGNNISDITPLRSFDSSDQKFCMEAFQPAGNFTRWKINNNLSQCDAAADTLAPNLTDPKVEIELKNFGDPVNKVEAIVTVSYKPASGADPNYREKVTNSIILIQ